METVTDVAAALQDLASRKGAKPADVIKDFNLLLNSRDDEVSNNISQILETFQPSTQLGKLLRLKLISRYSVSSEVLTLLQSDDTFQIHQALKYDWFFEDVQDPMSFVENELSKLSLTTRLKVINKYAKRLKNVEAGNVIYTGVKSRYGVKSAVPMLPVCGEDFIRKELVTITILLPPSVVLDLLDKHQSIATEYIKFLVSDEISRKPRKLGHYECVLEQLSEKDICTFIELFKEYGHKFPDNMYLGRRRMKKAIKTNFDNISKNYSHFKELFYNKKRFIGCLSLEQVKNLYVTSMLPSKLTEFFESSNYHDSYVYLDYVKPSVRSDIIVSTFQLMYKKDCLSSDLVHKFKFDWLQHLPIETRIEWVNLKLPEIYSAEEQAEAIAYLPVETSLPRLKQLITAQSSAVVRMAIAKQMVKTLKLNQCHSSIKDVAQYFVDRFRNETKSFRQTIISEIGLLGDLLLKMDWEDWPSMHDFIDLIKVNDEIPFCQGGLRSIYSHEIHGCFLKKLDVHPYLSSYVEFEQTANRRIKSSIFKIGKRTPYHKQCIEWFLKELPSLTIVTEEDDGGTPVVVTLLDTLVDYNRHHRKSTIELPEWLMNEIDKMVISADPEKEPWQLWKVFELLAKNKNFEHRDRLSLQHFPVYMDTCMMGRFLKNNPDLILTNIEFIMNKIFGEFYMWKYNHYKNFVKRCKLYEEIRVSIIKAGLTKLEEVDETTRDGEIEVKNIAVEILSELMTPSSYLEFCLNRLAVTNKTKNSKEEKMEYGIQRAIRKSLLHVAAPLETLQVVRKISRVDKLKVVGGSLMGVCVRIPENIILNVLEEWLGSPAPLRKHILRLIIQIAPIEYSLAVFKKILKTEKNKSLRRVLFLHVRNIFILNPKDDSYNTFISIVEQLNEDDETTLDKLFDFDYVDDAYLSQYIQLLWQLIDSKWHQILPKGKSRIVDYVDKKVIKLLSNSVCDKLVEHELASKLPNKSAIPYTCLYLLYSPSTDVMDHRLHIVISSLEPLIKNTWNNYERFAAGYIFVVRHLISEIVDSLCVGSLSTGDSAIASAVLGSMKESLLKLVQMKDLLKECIQIDAYTLYLSLKDSTGESTYATALAELYNNYIQKYDDEFRYSLIRNLTREIPMVSNTELAHELLKNHTHPSCHILATKILSNELNEENDTFRTIIQILSSSSHPHVQVAASDYFRTLEVTTVLSNDNFWTKCP